MQKILSVLEKYFEYVEDENDETHDKIANVSFFLGLIAGIPYGFSVGGLGGVLIIPILVGVASWMLVPLLLLSLGRLAIFGFFACLLAVVFWIVSSLWGVGI